MERIVADDWSFTRLMLLLRLARYGGLPLCAESGAKCVDVSARALELRPGVAMSGKTRRIASQG
jgi:hypothetical protein